MIKKLCCISLLSVCLLPCLVKAQVSYELPKKWEGKTEGETEGNPYVKNRVAVWRLDSIWPNKPEIKASSFVPMVWEKEKSEWRDLKNQQGGQPSAKVEDGNLSASSRGEWDGNPGQKLTSLAFINPSRGKYAVSGTVDLTVFDGNGEGAQFLVVKKRKGSTKIEVVQAYPVSKTQNHLELDTLVENLMPGDEIRFYLLFKKHHDAASWTIKDLKLTWKGP